MYTTKPGADPLQKRQILRRCPSSSEEVSEPIYCSLPCLRPEGGGVDGCKRCINEGLISG